MRTTRKLDKTVVRVSIALLFCAVGVIEAQIYLDTDSILSADSAPISPQADFAIRQHSGDGMVTGTELFTAPSNFGQIAGMAVLDDEIYVVGSNATGVAPNFGRLDRTNRMIVDVVSIPGVICDAVNFECPVDLGILSGEFLTATRSGRVLRFDASGSVLQTIDLPYEIGGIDAQDSFIAVVGRDDGTIHLLDLLGNEISSVSVQTPLIEPCSLDYRVLTETFLVLDAVTGTYFEIGPTGEVVFSNVLGGISLTGIQWLGDGPEGRFIRGDSNVDGGTNIADSIHILSFLFPTPGVPSVVASCWDSSDANNDGVIDIGDAILILTALFFPIGPLPAPFPDCGFDGQPAVPEDLLGCDQSTCF